MWRAYIMVRYLVLYRVSYVILALLHRSAEDLEYLVF